MALAPRQQQCRFSYRPLTGQGEARYFGESRRVDSTPTQTNTDVASVTTALAQWLGEDPRCGLIDLRPEADFARGHLPGSTSLPWGDHISGADFIARAHELPERGTKLALLAEDVAVAAAAADHLRRAGYVVDFTVALPAADLASSVWQLAPAASVTGSRQLWRPSPCLQELIETIERQLGVLPVSSKTVLDLGCGTGRDCVFLAKRGGFAVTGIDYLEKQLVRARDLASRCGVAEACTFREVDVCTSRPVTWLPAKPADVLHIGRFLHRPLLPVLRDHCVAPGGFVVYHTFMVGCEAFGRPRKPEHLLREGELRQMFAGWHVLMDEVRPCSDGRPLSWFAARRPLAAAPPVAIPKVVQHDCASNIDIAISEVFSPTAAGSSGPTIKRKKPDCSGNEQRRAEAATLPRRFASFYQGVGPRFGDDWDAFEQSLLTPHRGFCFRVCGGAAAVAATEREMLATFGSLILPAETAAGAAGLRRLQWTADGGRSWRFVASRSELRSDPQLTSFRDWVVKRQRTGQVRKEALADMLPVVALLRESTVGRSTVERVLDVCAAPPHLAPGVATGRLLDCLWGGGDYTVAGTTGKSANCTPQAKRLLVSNEPELSRCWMVLQDIGLPGGRRALSPLVLCAYKPENFPVPSATAALSEGFDRVLLQVPCSADAQFRKNGAGSSACRDWEPRTGMRLHKRQLESLVKSLKLLQIGGTLVYSSRSFNPLECEAVVAAALELCGESVVLESMDSDDGHILLAGNCRERDDGTAAPGALKIRAGMTEWRVPNLAHRSWRQDLEGVASAVGMMESPNNSTSTAAAFGPWYSSHAEAIQGGSTALPSFFPPTDEKVTRSLRKCIRLLPHDNDSDGCFVAVLKRVASLSSDMSLDNPSGLGGDEEVLPSKAGDARPATTSSRGDFSVPVSLRATLCTGSGGVVACTDALPGWQSVRTFLGLDVALTPALSGCVLLTTQQIDKQLTGGRLASVYAATAAAASLAQSMLAVVRVGALVVVPSSARVTVTQSAGYQEDGCCTHRLADGSARWVLRWTGARIVKVRDVAELVGLALGDLRTVAELGHATQTTLSMMVGGCVVYTADDGDESEAAASYTPWSGLGLGLESVVGWKTAGSKLMVFVGKPIRQLAKERRAAFALQ